MLQEVTVNGHHADTSTAPQNALQREVGTIAAEIEANISWVKAKRQALIQEDLRRFFQASFSDDGAKVSLDRIVAELQAIKVEVHDSMAKVRVKLEGLVQQELIHAVETALNDEESDDASSPTAEA